MVLYILSIGDGCKEKKQFQCVIMLRAYPTKLREEEPTNKKSQLQSISEIGFAALIVVPES